MYRARLWHAPLVIVLWQTAPVAVAPDPLTHRYRLYVGAEAGQFEDRSLACDGSVISAVPVDLRRAGAAFDGWLSPNTEVQASLGVGDGSGHGAVRLTGQWRPVGIGFGAWGGSDYEDGSRLIVPSFYFRVGNADALHALLDVFPPDLGPVAGGWARLGLGYRQGLSGGTGGFVGLTVPPLADAAYTLGGQAELHTPVTASLDLVLRGLVSGGYLRATWGGGIGLRYTMP